MECASLYLYNSGVFFTEIMVISYIRSYIIQIAKIYLKGKCNHYKIYSFQNMQFTTYSEHIMACPCQIIQNAKFLFPLLKTVMISTSMQLVGQHNHRAFQTSGIQSVTLLPSARHTRPFFDTILLQLKIITNFPYEDHVKIRWPESEVHLRNKDELEKNNTLAKISV